MPWPVKPHQRVGQEYQLVPRKDIMYKTNADKLSEMLLGEAV